MPRQKKGTCGAYDPIKKKYYPVLAAFDNGRGGLAAWCPWCCDWHHHSQGDGHRVGHCWNMNSPFREGGYILRKVKLPLGFVIARFKTKV